ncbi:transcription factor IIIC subunit delta N-term-domain-containing protein [Coprinopsis sp. MPI-PUGE-AT-0042]|nr:transcription factor IIIC subunit delta N-term-domain-containing protein [Coprinopsis sp. MPI-PUGE-AT-0042]
MPPNRAESTGKVVQAALSIPTAIAYPSPQCIQWSPEGQLLFVTKSCVYILTPDHGVNFDNESAIKAPLKEEHRDHPQTIAWFRTIAQDSKMSDGTHWPDLSQEWGAVSLGSIDTSIMSVACSPCGVSSDGRMVLALLTSNMDLSLWKAGKNYLRGEWHKIKDVTPLLISQHTPDIDTANSAAAVLQSQTTCMTWASRADFHMSPAPSVDSSLLILGNRAGCLTFLRYQAEASSVETLTFRRVSNYWVTKVDVSPWLLFSPGVAEAHVAFACSNGDVGFVKLRQRVSSTSVEPALSSNLTLDIEVDPIVSVLESDPAGVTALQWIAVPIRTPILVITKPGVVHLWSSAPPQEAFWSGFLSIDLETQPVSTAASAFHPPSGIVYLRQQDCLVLSLFDGSIHTIHHLSRQPTLVNTGDATPLTSGILSTASRSIFEMIEEGTNKKTMNRINGLVSYDEGQAFLWAQEASIPSDFSYKHDAKHSNTIVVAHLWSDPDESSILPELERALDCDTSSPVVPLHLLRPTFSRLQGRATFEGNREGVLGILRTPVQDTSADIHLPKVQGPLNDDARQQVRMSLKTQLFGWRETVSLRMRLSIADFVWKYSTNEEQQTQCGTVAQGILSSVSHRNLRVLIRHMVAAVDCLSAEDVPFILRLILQSALPGSPQGLIDEGQALTSLTQTLVSPQSITQELNELCPACKAPVPLHDITNAVCPNGHQWRRCSITTFILSTPWVRTCVGCSRKAFLAPSMSMLLSGSVQLPSVAQGWVVHELLEAVNQCLYCNNNFVCLL